MFDIFDDTIEFRGRPVARFLPGIGYSLRENASDELSLADGGKALEDAHEKVIDELIREHDEEIERRKARLAELATENRRLQAALDAIDGAGEVLILQAELKAARKEMSEAAEKYTAAALELRKPRRRRA